MKKLISLLLIITACYSSSFAQPGSMNQALITDFSQGLVKVSKEFQKCSGDHNLGNCATIALIKAALATFKTIDNVYSEFTRGEGGSYHMVFADGVIVDVSAAEVTMAKDLSGIKNTGGKYYEDAIIMYASICKRILVQKEDPGCVHNFKNAVEDINSGHSTSSVHELLGLKRKDIPVSSLATCPGAVIWCSAHAAYCSMGMQDLLGEKVPIKNGKKMRNLARYSKIKGAYILTK